MTEPTLAERMALERLNEVLATIYPTVTGTLDSHGVEITVLALIHTAAQVATQTHMPDERMNKILAVGLSDGASVARRLMAAQRSVAQ